MGQSIAKMLNVEVGLRPSVRTRAELDQALEELIGGRPQLGRDWLRLAPHYLQKNALEVPRSHFAIHDHELSVRPFGNIAIERRVEPTEVGFRKHELLLVRKEDCWIAVVVFAKYQGQKRKKKRKGEKKCGVQYSVVSGGLPSLGKRR